MSSNNAEVVVDYETVIIPIQHMTATDYFDLKIILEREEDFIESSVSQINVRFSFKSKSAIPKALVRYYSGNRESQNLETIVDSIEQRKLRERFDIR